MTSISRIRRGLKMNVSDALYICFDMGRSDISVLTIFRKYGNEVYLIKQFTGQEAVDVYNLLTVKDKEESNELH